MLSPAIRFSFFPDLFLIIVDWSGREPDDLPRHWGSISSGTPPLESLLTLLTAQDDCWVVHALQDLRLLCSEHLLLSLQHLSVSFLVYLVTRLRELVIFLKVAPV